MINTVNYVNIYSHVIDTCTPWRFFCDKLFLLHERNGPSLQVNDFQQWTNYILAKHTIVKNINIFVLVLIIMYIFTFDNQDTLQGINSENPCDTAPLDCIDTIKTAASHGFLTMGIFYTMTIYLGYVVLNMLEET